MEFKKALLDPAKHFDSPAEVVGTDDLTKAQKLEILRRWEDDARQLQEAALEGMWGGEQPELRAIRDAIRQVSGEPD